MRIWTRRLAIVFLILGVGTAPRAAPPDEDGPSPATPGFVKIYAPAWGLTLSDDGSGFYNDLARFVLTPDVGPANYEILPHRRAARTFAEDADACYWPAALKYFVLNREIPSTDGFIESRPIVTSRHVVLARPGLPAPKNRADLDGRTIGYPIGTPPAEYFKGLNVRLIAVADEVGKAQMLLTGRVDFITASIPDALFVFRHLGAALPAADDTVTLSHDLLTVACHDTAANRAFIDRLDASVTGQAASGALAAFFAAQGLDARYLPPAAE